MFYPYKGTASGGFSTLFMKLKLEWHSIVFVNIGSIAGLIFGDNFFSTPDYCYGIYFLVCILDQWTVFHCMGRKWLSKTPFAHRYLKLALEDF